MQNISWAVEHLSAIKPAQGNAEGMQVLSTLENSRTKPRSLRSNPALGKRTGRCHTGFSWVPIARDPKMLGVRNRRVVVLLCCLQSWQDAAEVRHMASIFTGLDSKLLKLREVSPLLSIVFDMNLNKNKHD